MMMSLKMKGKVSQPDRYHLLDDDRLWGWDGVSPDSNVYPLTTPPTPATIAANIPLFTIHSNPLFSSALSVPSLLLWLRSSHSWWCVTEKITIGLLHSAPCGSKTWITHYTHAWKCTYTTIHQHSGILGFFWRHHTYKIHMCTKTYTQTYTQRLDIKGSGLTDMKCDSLLIKHFAHLAALTNFLLYHTVF